MEKEILLLKGNEALAYAAVRCGCDAYFGYPITPQSEVLETFAELQPWKTTGMVVLQAESEVASINMLYGAGGCGKKVMTSSASVGIALMQEGISYMAGAEVPWEPFNLRRVTTIKLLAVAVMVTTNSLSLRPTVCRRWLIS